MTDEKKPPQEAVETGVGYGAARFAIEISEAVEKNWGLVRRARSLEMPRLTGELEDCAKRLEGVLQRVKPSVLFESQ